MRSSTEGPGRAGCLVYGLLIAATLSIVLAAGLAWWMYTSVRNAVDVYTSDSPAEIQAPAFDSEVGSSAKAEFERASQVLDDPNASGTFAFSIPQLNALLASPSMPDSLRGRIVVSQEGEELSARFSVRIGDLDMWPALMFLARGKEERFINGYARGVVQDDSGKAKIALSMLELGGKDLGEIGAEEGGSWLTGWLRMEVGPEARSDRLSRISGLSVQHGELRLSVGQADRSKGAHEH